MKKSLIAIMLLIAAFGCKKAFTPKLLNSNVHYLVIEGHIDGADSTFIRLSRTRDVDTLKTISPELGAVVTIESSNNVIIPLTSKKPGIYVAPPFGIDTSLKYRLRIKTSDSEEYMSDYVPVKNSPPIDAIGFTANSSAVGVYVNTHDAANLTRYYRWEFTETWQFKTPFITAWLAPKVPRLSSQQIHQCFGSDTSANVIIGTTIKLANDIVFQSPITKIASNSEKIETKYSILVKQYALTADAYAFWQNLQNNTENLGSIFSVLPSQTPTNFHCVSNTGELVIGYLSVGSSASKRIFISAAELPPSYSPSYPEICGLDTLFINPISPGQISSTAVYNENPSAYKLIEGLYLEPKDIFGNPTAYTYSSNICTDCTIRGTTKTPAFWK